MVVLGVAGGEVVLVVGIYRPATACFEFTRCLPACFSMATSFVISVVYIERSDRCDQPPRRGYSYSWIDRVSNRYLDVASSSSD